MRIITQNVQHWWGKRFENIIKECLKHDPDVFVLTERRNNKNEQYTKLNIPYHQYIISDVTGNKNTVCILTKELWKYLGNYKSNSINIQYKTLNIRWVYFPQKEEKGEVFDYLSNTIQDTNSLVIWDFNTGKWWIDEQWKTFSCHEEFLYLSEKILIDARRTRNTTKKEYSRYSNAGNGFRIDHVLATKDINEKIISIYYNHETRNQWLSDHSMMIVDIG